MLSLKQGPSELQDIDRRHQRQRHKRRRLAHANGRDRANVPGPGPASSWVLQPCAAIGHPSPRLLAQELFQHLDLAHQHASLAALLQPDLLAFPQPKLDALLNPLALRTFDSLPVIPLWLLTLVVHHAVLRPATVASAAAIAR